MSLEDEIQSRLVVDAESILQNNLDRVEDLFQLYGDGTIEITGAYRDTAPEIRLLVYLVAQRFAQEGDIAEEDTLSTEFFYERIDRQDRTIREYLQDLREAGLIKKESKSSHRLIAENLPAALDRIEAAIETDDESD